MTQSEALPRSRRRAKERLRVGLRGAGLLAVMALGTLLAAKIEFRSPYSNDVFYVYGIGVTTVIFLTMGVSIICYRDPARSNARAAAAELLGASAGPLVSCVVAVHNEQDLIAPCIASIVGQSYQNKEVIVIDDASTDGTVAALRILQRGYGFSLIELQENRGKKAALASGLLKSRGEVIAFADSDTVWNR